ncbi:PfkB family carbohydrate kinase [Chryseolinea lacunae]|uniref:Ribokinase n=1 Tax=Chryseolinea lacunae TaxID=2801331 RepID=A0ABS1KNK7_9BACT|nr:PfkB family carbohydrate kinase [Chryseolinea lacunae]MBL0740930.1 ribokinase [Chryseolinea lacunae]
MFDICCIGHITLDKVVTPQKEVHMAGGTSFYFSNAIRNMDVRYTLVTALGTGEMRFVADLRAKGIDVHALPSAHTVYFENIYGNNIDHRTQNVLQIADPFTVEQLAGIQAEIYHLGPLLAHDMPAELIQQLASRGKVSLDVQGFLRKVENKKVIAIDWAEKRKALPYVHIIKANEHEMEALTLQKDPRKGARILHEWGVNEVIITLGSHGSIILHEGKFYDIPAFVPQAVVDATGCGDTYMAGYLCKRIRGAGFQEAGEFGAAMASIKLESSGPFTGSEAAIAALIQNGKKTLSIPDAV